MSIVLEAGCNQINPVIPVMQPAALKKEIYMARNQDSACWGEGAWNEILKCLNILGESIINWNNYLFGVNEILETFPYLSSWTLLETLSSRTRHWPLTGMDITSVTIKPSTTKKMAKGLTNMTSILLSSSMAFSTSTVVSTWPHSQLDIRIYLVSLQAWYMTTLTNTVSSQGSCTVFLALFQYRHE